MTNPKRILALDLGSCAFKLAVLEPQEPKPVLTHVRLLEIPAQAEPNVRQAVLRSLLEGIDLSHLGQVVSVVDDPFACLHQVSVPPMPAAELADAAKWELQRFLTVPPDEVALDYRILGQQEEDGVKKQRLIAVAMPAAAIREHLAFLAQAGVRPVHLIPKTVALNAWVARTREPESKNPLALLEVGGSGAEFIVVENGEAVFSRKLPFSSAALTREMTGLLMTGQGQVSLTEGEAETIKRSIGIPKGDAGGMGMKGVSGMQIFSLIRGSLERLAVETERSLAFYGESGSQAVLGELVLVGGGAQMKELTEWLQGRLGIRVTVPKVFQGVSPAPGAVQGPAAAAELSLAPVLGAALGSGKGMNLLPIELQENLHASIQKAALKAVVTGGVLGAALLWIGLQVYHQSLAGQISGFEVEQKAVAQQLPAIRAAVAVRDRWRNEPDWEEVFRALTRQIPNEIYLTELAADGPDLVLRGRIRKAGRSADEVLSRFMQALGEGSMKAVTLRSSRQLEESADQAEFEIGGKL